MSARRWRTHGAAVAHGLRARRLEEKHSSAGHQIRDDRDNVQPAGATGDRLNAPPSSSCAPFTARVLAVHVRAPPEESSLGQGGMVTLIGGTATHAGGGVA